MKYLIRMMRMTTYLTGDIGNRAGSDFLHLDNLRDVFFDFDSPGCLPSMSIVLDDISAITVTLNVFR
jgi:hypothetical protein